MACSTGELSLTRQLYLAPSDPEPSCIFNAESFLPSPGCFSSWEDIERRNGWDGEELEATGWVFQGSNRTKVFNFPKVQGEASLKFHLAFTISLMFPTALLCFLSHYKGSIELQSSGSFFEFHIL